ncbi:hypothetical protein CYMTET_8642 [Cymbomonas tetramitiformis]|uniref:DUF4145 domain-containing protein n=1 Tax=Cymbomonas tetramitiformis TaxID=36881 RepID=A0AAE0GSW2_9CHLO|nr:hypothetical protein CYMTET_8642 [Cymbomonas tetramitiformis]
MGLSGSKHSANDFELVIRAAKELEYRLQVDFGAQGSGIHEKLSSIPGLPPALVRDMRYLATLRNKLVHERDFNSLPDREKFIERFEKAEKELAWLCADGKGEGGRCIIS